MPRDAPENQDVYKRQVGSNTIVMHGAVLNDAVKVWNDKVIEAGSMVLEDLVTGHGSGNRITFDEKVVIGNVEREMRPETLMKLGAIFATLCGRGSKIAVSSNGSAATMMGKYAVILSLIHIFVLRFFKYSVVSRYNSSSYE